MTIIIMASGGVGANLKERIERKKVNPQSLQNLKERCMITPSPSEVAFSLL
jgi:hypothetical protein